MIRLLCTFTLLLLATLDLSECLLRGYTNSRSWGTGRQGRVEVEDSRRTSRMGRRLTLPSCRTCEAEDTLTGPVCGTDGETYPSLCDLLQTACSLVRRQGRALQSPQLSLQQSHPGPCRPAADCAGMERLGQFSAWGVRATNFGLCVQDFFTCASTLVEAGSGKEEAQACCQARFDLCFRG